MKAPYVGVVCAGMGMLAYVALRQVGVILGYDLEVNYMGRAALAAFGLLIGFVVGTMLEDRDD